MMNGKLSYLKKTFYSCCLNKDSSGSSEEETSAAMAQSGRYSHKLDESDDDFNSNQFSPETATLSVCTF